MTPAHLLSVQQGDCWSDPTEVIIHYYWINNNKYIENNGYYNLTPDYTRKTINSMQRTQISTKLRTLRELLRLNTLKTFQPQELIRDF